MKRMHRHRWLACMAIAIASVTPARAITPVGATTRLAPPPPPASVAPSTAAVAVPSLDLIAGAIEAVDPSTQTMMVAGSTLAWHPTQLRVYGANGSAGNTWDLRAGLRIRFALEPGTSEPRRVVLVYVDGR